jgi:hypothetical protein
MMIVGKNVVMCQNFKDNTSKQLANQIMTVHDLHRHMLTEQSLVREFKRSKSLIQINY